MKIGRDDKHGVICDWSEKITWKLAKMINTV